MIKLKKIAVVLGAVIVMLLMSTVVLTITSKAEGSKVVKAGDTVIATEDASIMESSSSKAWAAGIAIAVVATGGAVAMGMSISKSVESIARQPEAEGKIRTTLMLGLVFIETAIIYALVVAILIIFVL